jgi:hypothetical protein
MDTHIPRAITVELRMRGVDVLTAQEDGTAALPDPRLLDRATQLGRVLFTYDKDFFAEATRRQRNYENFTGLIYTKPLRISIGQTIDDLEIITKAGKPEDMENTVAFLPL